VAVLTAAGVELPRKPLERIDRTKPLKRRWS
jgi:hypothetical protein